MRYDAKPAALCPNWGELMCVPPVLSNMAEWEFA